LLEAGDRREGHAETAGGYAKSFVGEDATAKELALLAARREGLPAMFIRRQRFPERRRRF